MTGKNDSSSERSPRRLVARVGDVHVGLVEARLRRGACARRGPSAQSSRCELGDEPCQVRPWWNEPPPAFDDDRHDLELLALGRSGSCSCKPIVRRVKLCALGRRLRPRVRAAYELERACVEGGVVERDPARDHLRRYEVVGVRGVLVEADRLGSRRLPEDVVLEDPHAAVAHELRGEPAGSLGEHLRGHDVVGLPGIAELARAIFRVATRNPVHLVRPDPGLVLAVEQSEVALPQELERPFRDEAFLHDRKPSRWNASTCSGVNASTIRATSAAGPSPGRRRGSGRPSPGCASEGRRACPPRRRCRAPRTGPRDGRARCSS